MSLTVTPLMERTNTSPPSSWITLIRLSGVTRVVPADRSCVLKNVGWVIYTFKSCAMNHLVAAVLPHERVVAQVARDAGEQRVGPLRRQDGAPALHAGQLLN